MLNMIHFISSTIHDIAILVSILELSFVRIFTTFC